jgi:multiple sugar transport system permease protein
MEKETTLAVVPLPQYHRRRWGPSSILGRDWMIALPFVLPIIILMGGFILYPFGKAISVSMHTRSLITRTEQYVGLDNYKRLQDDSDYISTVKNTFKFTIASVVIKFIFGMSIALLLNSKLPFRSILTGIILLPWIVPEVVTAFTFRSIYDPIFGGLNPILDGLGLIDRRVAWLAEPSLAMPSVIAVNVWKGIPFFTILLLAGLKALENEQYEAAEVDGANAIHRFIYITLPGLRYVIIVTGLLSFISTFNTFGLIYLLTGGGPGGATRVYSVLAYEKAIIGLRMGPGAATALSIAPVMIALIIILAWIMRRDDYSVSPVRTNLLSVMARVIGWAVSMAFTILVFPIDLLALGLDWISQRLTFADASGQPLLTSSQRDFSGMIIRLLLLLPVIIFVLFPFYWVVVTSFKTELQIQQFSSIYWPKPWTSYQYSTLLQDTPFLAWFRNTAFVATTATTISVILASLAAYALARLKFLGAGLLTTLLLVTYLLPAPLLFIPLYRILTEMGIINTHAALILTYPTFLMPFATWVMMGYFRSIPRELEEAALLDGSSRLGAFWRVALPLAAPGLLSVTLFAFTNAWNEFLFAFVFIRSDNLKTLPVGLQLLVFGDTYPWGQIMAAALLMTIPVVAIYIIAQRFLVEGLTSGSVKG